MKLPNADRAVVAPEKVRDYLLSPTHPVGRLKAAFFVVLGYSQEDWSQLQRHLLQIASEDAAVNGRFSRFGKKYEVPAMLTGPTGRSAKVLTVWIVRHGEDAPRFVTAMPGD